MKTCCDCRMFGSSECETCSILDELVADDDQTRYDVILKNHVGKIVGQAYDLLPSDLYAMQYCERSHQSGMTWYVTNWRTT
jgi:hypothetical protein